MASARPVRDSDTALWLHNKLGSIEEFWVSSSIGGIIKTDTIDNILRCFPVLSNAVKMKLLLGILHLPRRSLDEMKHTMGGVIELALDDIDQWISIVSNIVKHYPITCKLNLDMTSNPIVANIMKQLHEKFKASDANAMLPLECQYLNKNALMIMIGNQPPPQRHFALKRKPKSAALRVDLMQKSTDVSSHAKRSVVSGVMSKQTVPVKHRDMTRKFSDDSSSAKESHKGFGTPRSQLSSSSLINRGTSRFSGRAERGTKLLDISEQPVGMKETKRRRKQLQEEQSSQPANESRVPSTPTPEYAAGLIYPSSSGQSEMEVNSENYPLEQEMESQEEDLSIEKEAEGTNDDSDGTTSDTGNSEYQDTTSTSKQGPESTSYASSSLPEKNITYEMPATPSPFFNSNSALDTPALDTRIAYSNSARNVASVQMSPPVTRSPTKQNLPKPPTTPSGTAPQKAVSISYTNVMPSYAPPHPRTGPSSTPAVNTHLYSANIQAVSNQQALPMTPNPASNKLPQYTHVYQQPLYAALPGARPYMTIEKRPQGVASHHPLAVHQLAAPAYQAPKVGGIPIQSNQPSHSQTTQQPHPDQMQHQQKNKPPQKALTLTKEQMFQAQELFRSAPCLSRQEKAIILGFWAGSRENPSPEKGDILQIVLSQNEQRVQNPVNREVVPVIVETIFEMNYSTGMAVKKQRVKQITSGAHGKT